MVEGKACTVTLTTEDPLAIVSALPIDWSAELACAPDAPDGRLRFRVLDNSAVPTSVARDEPFCSGNTKKADRASSDQRPIEISYSPPSSSSGIATETFNVSISGKLDNFSLTTNFNYVFKNENQLIFDISRDTYQVSTVVWKM